MFRFVRQWIYAKLTLFCQEIFLEGTNVPRTSAMRGSRIFFRWVQAPRPENYWTLFGFFFSPQLILQGNYFFKDPEGVQHFPGFYRETTFSRIQRGSNIFQGGGPTFSRGGGGPGPPSPPPPPPPPPGSAYECCHKK